MKTNDSLIISSLLILSSVIILTLSITQVLSSLLLSRTQHFILVTMTGHVPFVTDSCDRAVVTSSLSSDSWCSHLNSARHAHKYTHTHTHTHTLTHRRGVLHSLRPASDSVSISWLGTTTQGQELSDALIASLASLVSSLLRTLTHTYTHTYTVHNTFGKRPLITEWLCLESIPAKQSCDIRGYRLIDSCLFLLTNRCCLCVAVLITFSFSHLLNTCLALVTAAYTVFHLLNQLYLLMSVEVWL